VKDVTVGIKTFKRDKKLFNLLNSLQKWNFKEVIVADDSNISPEKRKKYEDMKKKIPLTVLELPFDTGLSQGRNEIVKNTKTKYILFLDDDMIPYKISPLRRILDEIPDIGGVGGILIENNKMKCGAHNLHFKDGYLIRDVNPIPKIKMVGNEPFFVFDFIPNSALFRTRTLKDIPWDPKFKIKYEHLDFYLTHKEKGKWKFAVSPASFVGHFPSNQKKDNAYNKFRYGKDRFNKSENHFFYKWGFKGIFYLDAGFMGEKRTLAPIRIMFEKIVLRIFPTRIAYILRKIYVLIKDKKRS